MSTADYPVWLAVMPDQRDAARADAGKHPDGRSAIAWSKDEQLWYARPGADLSRLQKWLPDSTIRSSGGGDPQAEFLEALTRAGLVLDGLPVMDGRRHRVPTLEGKNGSRDGVYRGFLDGIKPGGWYINYHRADNDKDITRWKASGGTGEADPLARVHIRAVMRQSQDDKAREQAALYAQSTASAQALYRRLPAADPEHGYLTRKGITVAEDVRQTRNGALVVPFYDVSGAFRTLQYIPPAGEKYLYRDAPKSGHFRVEGGVLRNGEPILYAEGYATARSLYEVTGRPVVMTIDAGNMQAVAAVLKARYPDSPHLFMADVDHAKETNKGVLSADRAAAVTGGAVLLPDLTAAEIERGFTDFNDLHLFRGADSLRDTLLPDIAQALERLNYKDKTMATPDDAQPAPESTLSAAPDDIPAAAVMPSRRPGAAKEKTAEILTLRDQGLKPARIADQLGIGQTSVRRILREQESAASGPAVASTATGAASPAGTQATSAAPAVTETAAAPSAQPVVAPDAAPAVPPSSAVPQGAAAGQYDGFTGLYGTGAELRDRLTALVRGETSPAALLNDIETLRARVDNAARLGVYSGEHISEMQQMFDRVTKGGLAGAGIEDTGAFSRLRGFLRRQPETWASLHANGTSLDLNTIPDRVSAQYVMLARGEATRAQFDREVRMLYGEFSRAEPASFAPGRYEETQAAFARLGALQSPERAAQYAAGAAVTVSQLPPAAAADPNTSALYQIQSGLEGTFASLARGQTSASGLAEDVARLQARFEDAQAQGVYSDRHVREIQGAFDRLTKDGFAGMPSPDAPATGADYQTRYPLSATLDAASVPDRIADQYQQLSRGDITRAQFEESLVMLRNEVARLSEKGRVSPEALGVAQGAFDRLTTLSAPVAVSQTVAAASLRTATAAEAAPAAEAAAVIVPTDVPRPPAQNAVPAQVVPAPEASPAAPVAQSVPSDVQQPAADVSVLPEEPSASPVREPEALPPQAPPSEAFAAATEPAAGRATAAEENAIHVGAPRMTASGEEIPEGTRKVSIDADRLLSRITHETNPDGKSVLYRLDGEPAFTDHGNRLVMAEGASAHEEKVLAALLTAANHYHGRIELTGSDAFKAYAISVIVANRLDVTMKNASQQADLDAARRAAGQPVTPEASPDAVRGEPAAPSSGTAPPAARAAGTPAHADVQVTTSQQPAPPAPATPAAPKVSGDIHTPAEQAKQPVTGKVTACGQAPFRFEEDASESTFITLRTREGTQTYWGKELAGLIRETNLKPGRMVTLQWMGEQPVTVQVPKKNSDGEVTHYETRNTHRNQWSVTPAGGARVQTGGDEMVPLSAFDVNRYTQVQHSVVSRLRLDMPAPPRPADGLYWLRPDGQGSATPGDALSAARPAHNEHAGTVVMSSWAKDGTPDLYLVQGDGHYLQGVVRQEGRYQHVLVSLPDSKDAPPMVVNRLTENGAEPLGSGNGINRSNGQPVAREHVVIRLTGDPEPRIAKLDSLADVPAALHARLGYDERYRSESGWAKEQPAAAPQAAPVTPPRPAQ